MQPTPARNPYNEPMSRTFWVILIPQPEGGYLVDCPSLPDCRSKGETQEEALRNIHDAIQLALEDLAEANKPIPVQAGKPWVTEVRMTE